MRCMGRIRTALVVAALWSATVHHAVAGDTAVYLDTTNGASSLRVFDALSNDLMRVRSDGEATMQGLTLSGNLAAAGAFSAGKTVAASSYLSSTNPTRNAAALQQALNELGTNNCVLVIDGGRWDISAASLIFPRNITLKFLPDSCLDIATNRTVYIYGGIEAGLQRIFAGNGRGVKGDPLVPYIMPQWWGAKGDGTTNDAQAVRDCFLFASYRNETSSAADRRGTNGLTIFFPQGIYKTISACLSRTHRVTVTGSKAVIKQERNRISTDVGLVGAIEASNVRFCNLEFEGGNTNAPESFILAGNVQYFTVDHCVFHDAEYTQPSVAFQWWVGQSNRDVTISHNLHYNWTGEGIYFNCSVDRCVIDGNLFYPKATNSHGDYLAFWHYAGAGQSVDFRDVVITGNRFAGLVLLFNIDGGIIANNIFDGEQIRLGGGAGGDTDDRPGYLRNVTFEGNLIRNTYFEMPHSSVYFSNDLMTVFENVTVQNNLFDYETHDQYGSPPVFIGRGRSDMNGVFFTGNRIKFERGAAYTNVNAWPPIVINNTATQVCSRIRNLVVADNVVTVNMPDDGHDPAYYLGIFEGNTNSIRVTENVVVSGNSFFGPLRFQDGGVTNPAAHIRTKYGAKTIIMNNVFEHNRWLDITALDDTTCTNCHLINNILLEGP